MVKIFTIVTVCKNPGVVNLEKTIKSVISQDRDLYEYIVIDGNSTDGSQIVFEKYKSLIDIYISEQDDGPADAMNKAVKMSKGQYLLFLNAGDTLVDSQVLKDVEERLGLERIYCGKIFLQEKGLIADVPNKRPNVFFFFFDSLHHQASFIHRELFENFPYDTNYRYIFDQVHLMYCLLTEKVGYKALDRIISNYDLTGISSKASIDIIFEEKKRAYIKIFGFLIGSFYIFTYRFVRWKRYEQGRLNFCFEKIKSITLRILTETKLKHLYNFVQQKTLFIKIKRLLGQL